MKGELHFSLSLYLFNCSGKLWHNLDMHIDRLVLSGFKSFPSRTVIRFHPGITAIVGPNGSGKSNIVDAILWVLGEARSSILRTNSLSDLIFKGSASRAPLSRAEVTLQFIDPKTEESFIVGRRVYAEGQNEFLLDGKLVRFKDVQDRLWEAGIESREYVVIEQGRVEALIKMKAEDRKVFLEAAAGVSRYREKRKESLRKIWETEKDLEAIAARELTEREMLERAEKKLEVLQEYRRLKSQLLSYQENLFGARAYKIVKALDEKRKQRNRLAEQIETEEKSLQMLIEERKALSSELDKETREIEEKRSLLEGKKQNLMLLEEEANRLRERKAVTETEIASLENRLEEIENQKEKGLEKISSLHSKIAQTGAEFEKLSSFLHSLQEEVKVLRNLAEEKRKTFLLQSEELQKRRSALSLARERVRTLEWEIRTRQRQLQDLARTLTELSLSEEDLSSLEEEKKKVEEELRKTTEEKERLKTGRREISERLQEMKQEKAALEASLRTLKKLLGKGSSGQLVEMIRGEKELLKLAELLWADEMKARVIKGLEEISGPGVYFLPDRVQPEFDFKARLEIDPSIRPFLRDALWANSLEEAYLLWKEKGTTVVFPEGIFLENNLLIIKGEEESFLALKAEKEQTEKGLSALEKEIAVAEEERKRLQKEERNLSLREKNLLERLKNLEKELEKAKMEIVEAKTKRELYLKRQNQLQQELSELTRKLELERENLKEDPELEEFQKEVSSLKRESDEAYKKLREKDGLIAKTREKLSAFNERLVMLKDQKANLEKQLEESRESEKKIQEKLQALRSKLKDLQKELKEFSKKQEKELKDFSALEEELKKLEEAYRKKERKLKSLAREIEKRKQSIQERKNLYTELKFEVESLEKELNFLDERIYETLGKRLNQIDLLEEADESELEKKIEEIKTQKEALGDVDFNAEREYAQLKESLNKLLQQKDDLLTSIENLKKIIARLDREYHQKMEETLSAVNETLNHLFQQVFSGGEARVSFTDKEEKGVEIEIKFPGRRKQELNMLSGGEKALVSLLFHLALFKINPAPFLILDEVDAPLDNANLAKLLSLMDALKKETQIIIITHNPITIKRADFVFGVSMPEPGVSRVYSVERSKLFEEKNV